MSPSPDEIQIVPAEIRRRIAERTKNRQLDLVHQVALLESGLSAYHDEKIFCEEYGITQAELESVRKWKRAEIERFKEEHREGKFMLVRLLGRRERYMMMLEDAILKGDKDTEKKIRELLKTLTTYAPVSELKEIAETLKLVKDDGDGQTMNATQVNINLNPAIQNAERILKEKKVVDVK